MQTTDYPDVPPDFGHWLAGFLDGEACFFIQGDACRKGNACVYCGVKVALRDDDAAIIELIHTTTGVGNIWRSDWHHRQRASNKPIINWEVGSHADCMRLVAILDEYPLRSKKARDYAIWREAVFAKPNAKEPAGGRLGQKGGRATKDWSRLIALKEQLKATRAYR